MVPLNKQVLLIALLIAICNGFVHASSTSQEIKRREKIAIFPPKTAVRVYNNLGEGLNLTLHCKSKNDDLGNQVIADNNYYEWKFRINVWETTLFFCGISWKNTGGTFDIYTAQRDSHRCVCCVWRVTRDGVRGFNTEGGEEQIWFRWGDKPPKQWE